MIVREATHRVLVMAKSRPVVTIVGPRHAGKSTFVKNMFPHHKYVNLEAPDVREFALRNPAEFLKYYSGGIVVDEYRRVPELINHIYAAATNTARAGQFILVTSHLPIGANITPTYKNLIATQVMLPLTIRELYAAKFRLNRDEYIYRGFMPRTYNENADPKHIYRNYHTYYVNRDIRLFVNLDIQNQYKFEQLIKYLAEHVGQIINPIVLANNLAISKTTLVKWLAALEASFIIFRLPYYHNSFGQRISKIPKFYFTDVGLATYLLGIKNVSQVFRDPQIGGLFENMVIAEAMKYRHHLGLSAGLYYYRIQNNIEIDLLISNFKGIMPIEIKSALLPNNAFTKNIRQFRKLSAQIRPGCVIYSGKTSVKNGKPKYINFNEIRNILQ